MEFHTAVDKLHPEKASGEDQGKMHSVLQEGSIEVVAQHTCPDALISCSIGAANTVLKERMSQLIRRNVSMQSSHVNNATRIPPWPTRNFILKRLAQGEKSIAL